MQANMQPLAQALAECADVQAVIGEATLLVRDFTEYRGDNGEPGGIIIKVNDEEPDGIHNSYFSLDEIERDLATVVPGYVKGAPVWQEYEEEDRWG